MSEKVKAITAIPIADTGILTELEEEERIPLEALMSFVIEKIQMRKSRKYGPYAVFDGENLDGEKIRYFTMSGVLTSQAEMLLDKYGTDNEGNLSAPILASVVAKKSEGGRFYLTFQ
jgi:hypothetical protein